MDLKENQKIFVQARSSGESILQAAKLAGISEMTAHRWLKQTEVQKALSTVSIEVMQEVESAADRIRRRYTEQIDTSCSIVIDIASDVMAPAQARLKAVQMIQERVAPLQTTNGIVDVASTNQKQIDWSAFTEEELNIILPIFLQAEARARENKRYA